MHTDAEHVHSTQHAPVPGVMRSAWHFVLHFVEMCLAMCIGGIPLLVLFFWGAARLGYPDLLQRSPEFSVLAIGLILSLPMVGWMRFRGMNWRLTLEMASTTIILGIVSAALGWLGVLSGDTQLELMKTLACPSMLVPMLFRLDHYTGRAGHAMHHGHQHES